MLASINSTLLELLTYIKYKYIKHPELEYQYPSRFLAVQKILDRYNPDNLIENSPQDTKGDTSYTMDKGSIIALCLRDKKTTHYVHHLPILLFVAIHELAHVAIDDNDHPPKFWATFKWLLLEAEEANIYTSPDFRQNPSDYCGMNVDYNPRLDPSVRID